MKQLLPILRAHGVALALALVASGCRTTAEIIADYNANYAAGNYEQASKEVVELAADQDGDELLWQLLASSALRNAGSPSSAVLPRLDRAEDIMDEYDKSSVFSSASAGALAMLTNDKAFGYDGGGQDRIFTCLYKAIDYASDGNVTAARVELNRAGEHQEQWLDERRKDITAAKERLDKEAASYAKDKGGDSKDAQGITDGVIANSGFSATIRENLGYDTRTSENLDTMRPVDWMNPYVSHVTGVYRWLIGDDARNYFKDAKDCRGDNRFAVADYNACDTNNTPRDEVWVYVEDGLCPERQEWRIDLPLILVPYANKYIFYAGMAFPQLKYRDVGGNSWAVTANRRSESMAEIADMDRLVKIEYDVYMHGALAREITRTVVKIGVQVALGIAADNSGDWKHKLALRAAQAGVAAWAASTTAADVRCWTALPKRVLVARVKRPSDGRISITADGRPVTEVKLPKGNSMVFVTKPSPSARAAVKAVTIPNK